MLDAISRLLRRKPKGPENDAFMSKFGGLWIDRVNAEVELERRVRDGKIPADLAAKISGFIRDGYVIFRAAVAPELADRLAATIDAAYANGDSRLRYHTDGAEHHIPVANTDPRGKRIVEAHAVLSDVRAALGSPPVMQFLMSIFEESPVLTQTLIFQTGSEQGFHQDPVFVPFDEPLRMSAAWVALEDTEEGSGELQYLVKSHSLPDYVFSNGRRDSHGAEAGEVAKFSEWLLRESESRALERLQFRAKKGDVLIWHAGLAHGGSPITKAHATRRSLVGHFCPKSTQPRYPNATNRGEDHGLLYSSYLYNVDDPV